MSSDVTIWQGDCLELMKRIPEGTIDAVITDPPYGLDLGIANDKRQDSRHLGRKSYAAYDDTYENFVGLVVPRINAALAIAKRGAVFSGPHLQEQAKASAIGGIWHPSAIGRTSWGFKNFLPVLFYGTAPDLHNGHHPIVMQSTAVSEKNGHPCPKPLSWMIWLVERVTLPGEMVLDPFAGSGTTLVACLKTGRRCIGMEIDPTYIPIIHRRVKSAEMPLFAPVGNAQSPMELFP